MASVELDATFAEAARVSRANIREGDRCPICSSEAGEMIVAASTGSRGPWSQVPRTSWMLSSSRGATSTPWNCHGTSPAEGIRDFAAMIATVPPLIVMVISEMEASTNGIGFFILQSQRSFAIPEMWSGIILLGLLGYTVNAVFVLLERRLLRWHRGAMQSAIDQPAAGTQAA